MHVQIVLVPGVNDGDVLDRTLEWLAARRGRHVGRRRSGRRDAVCPDDRRHVRGARGRARGAGRARAVAAAHAGRARRALGVRGRRALPRPREPGFRRGTTTTASRSSRTASGWRAPSSTSSRGGAAGPASRARPRGRRARDRRAVRAGARTLAPSLGAATWCGSLAVPNRLLGRDRVRGRAAGRRRRAPRRVRNDAGGAGGPYLVPDVAVNADGLFLDDLTLGGRRSERSEPTCVWYHATPRARLRPSREHRRTSSTAG